MINLTTKQRYALEQMYLHRNIFITGAGGTGKSKVIEIFYKTMKNKCNISLTSTTGISAINIGGSTVHSYLGLGLGNNC